MVLALTLTLGLALTLALAHVPERLMNYLEPERLMNYLEYLFGFLDVFSGLGPILNHVSSLRHHSS